METTHKWRESFYENLLFTEDTQNYGEGMVYASQSVKPINFYCAAPQAGTVEIAGDFNHWQPAAMTRLLDGWWHIRLKLAHGHHHYRFIVDGEPQLDPRAMGVAHDETNDAASLMAVS